MECAHTSPLFLVSRVHDYATRKRLCKPRKWGLAIAPNLHTLSAIRTYIALLLPLWGYIQTYNGFRYWLFIFYIDYTIINSTSILHAVFLHLLFYYHSLLTNALYPIFTVGTWLYKVRFLMAKLNWYVLKQCAPAHSNHRALYRPLPEHLLLRSTYQPRPSSGQPLYAAVVSTIYSVGFRWVNHD